MQIKRRMMTPEDEIFVKQLILNTVSEELAAWAWPEALRAQLLEMQYKGRRQSIQEGYPGAECNLILADEKPVGWVVVWRTAEETRVVDIAILPENRGAGIGGAVLSELIEESNRERKPVRLNVTITNRAAHLYERLGFRRVGGDEVQHFLERQSG